MNKRDAVLAVIAAMVAMMMNVSSVEAGFTYIDHFIRDGHLTLWWTKDGVRLTTYPFYDSDTRKGDMIQFKSPPQANDYHEKRTYDATSKTSDTNAYAYPHQDFGEFLLVSGQPETSWYALGDFHGQVNVRVEVDLTMTGPFNLLPEDDVLFFDFNGMNPMLPGYQAFNEDTGQPFEGEMLIWGLNTIMLDHCSLAMNPGDANGDCEVGLLDLDILGRNWGMVGAGWWQGDFTGEGEVGLLDLDVLGGHWGMVYPMPEPGGLGVLVCGVVGMGLRRR